MIARPTTQEMRGWLGAALAGAVSAAVFVLAFRHAETGLVFLSYLAPLPLLLAGLGAGSVGGVIAGAIGSGGVLLSISPTLAVAYALINALPIAILTPLALRKRVSDGQLLTAIVVYPCAIFLLAAALAWGQEGGLLGLSQQVMETAINQVSQGLEPDAVAQLKIATAMLPQVFPSLVGFSWAFLILISALGAQSILQRQGWNRREPFVLRDVQIPFALILAVAITGLAGYFAPAPYDYVGVNLCVMLCVPLFIVGLAVVHAFAATKSWRIALLIAFYALLTFVPWVVILATLLGALDQVLHIRQRLAPTDSSGRKNDD